MTKSNAVAVHENAAGQPLSLTKHAGIVICASAVIAVCARLILPLPFTPVPLTLANFAVLLVGMVLGSKRGFAAAALYLAWGAMGLPVFAATGLGGIAQLLGPTGGYLWSYPVVAFIAGAIAERGVPSFTRNVLAGICGDLMLFVAGISWLYVMTRSWRSAAMFGLYPFLFAEVMKVALAAGLAGRLKRSF